LGLLSFFALAASLSASPSWVFNPQQAGRALYQGGWTAEYSLGNINASPEFSFPLQLIYLNSRPQKGMFGAQWFCPQLESSVVPKGAGFLVWTMPSGGMMGFKADTRRAAEYVSLDGNWRAKASASKQLIFNDEGWQYSYSRGRLELIASPTGRLLEFLWNGNTLQALQISDPATGARRVLASFAFSGGRQLLILQVNGQQHKFGYYQSGPDDRLAVYVPPLGEEIRFFYNPDSGVLARSQIGKDKDNLTDFVTAFVKPGKAGKEVKAADQTTPKKDPANFWITSDRDFDYIYGADPKDKNVWLADQVSLEGKTGLKRKMSYAGKRGIVTAKQEGTERKTYYYRAPGQKYDGKLRRIEENGELKAEYRYDRKTGLMSEMVDGKGVVTFFDYPADWKPLRRELWEPKPVRVRRGSAGKNEVIAQYSYDELGRLATAADAAGNVTRYAYTPRGEMASISDALGTKTVFTYDSYGRRISVARNDLKESIEYDEAGRISAHLAADGSRTDFNFDKTGLLSGIKRNGKAVTEYTRDATGKIIGEKDALGRVKKIERDARGNLLAETAPNGSVTRYEYDDQNRRIAQIDGNGNKITFAYDLGNRLAKQANPLGGTLTWKYDDQGRLVERTNGEQVITSIYDKEGKLAAVDYGAKQKIEYLYDKDGRISSAATPQSGIGYTYDKLGRAESARVIAGGEEQLLRYRYNPRGQRTGLILAKLIPALPSTGGRTGREAAYQLLQQTEYTYDEAGRLTAIISNSQPVVSYRYDSAGRMALKTFGNGMKADIAHDAMGRLARIAFSGGNLPEPQTLTYEWDAASQVTRRSWNGQMQRYEYDPSGQLLKAINDQSKEVLEAYAYDKAGNMQEKIINGEKTAMTYNAANQLATVALASLPMRPTTQHPPNALAPSLPGGTRALASVSETAQNLLTYTYDKAGRMTGPSGGAMNTYGWLDKVTTLTQPDGTQVAFEYWPDGQLAAKRTLATENTENAETGIQKISNPPATPSTINAQPSTSETFLWDGLALLRRNDTIYIIEPHPSGGVPIASHPVGKPEKMTWFLSDMLGTTLGTIENGVTRYAALTAFGQKLSATAISSTQPPANFGEGGTVNPLPQTDSIAPTAP